MNTILVIDDQDQTAFMSSLKDRAEYETSIETAVLQLDRSIPAGLDESDLRPIQTELDKYLSSRLDLVLCDINLNDKMVGLPLIIADYVRKKNKSCHIILYSGGLHKILDDLLDTKRTTKGKEVEKPIRALITATIAEMVERDKVENRAIYWLLQPSLLLQLERKLLEYENHQFENGYPNFRGFTLAQIAKEVREQSPQGVKFTQELFEQTLAHMIAINQ
jgi:hypothetical protein